MADPNEEHPHEIVIIKRRRDGDGDDHHGGVWKVAFADFMTAMMAFFLVLWIVNSTTKQTRSSLARYFNPVKLSDTTPARKGLQDPKEDEFDAAANGPGVIVNGPAENPKNCAETATKPPPAVDPHHDAPATDAHHGAPAAPAAAAVAAQDCPHKEARAQQEARGPQAAAESETDRTRREAQEANGMLAEIETGLTADELAKIGPSVDVSADPEGILISLTDRLDFGMFKIGSAEPELALTQALAAVGRVVRGRAGGVVVRGHTDSRPYRNRVSDNWRLSMERAQSALAILRRDGLEENRIERIEGYADHKPRKPEMSDAPENRRIEILLRRSRP